MDYNPDKPWYFNKLKLNQNSRKLLYNTIRSSEVRVEFGLEGDIRLKICEGCVLFYEAKQNKSQNSVAQY